MGATQKWCPLCVCAGQVQGWMAMNSVASSSVSDQSEMEVVQSHPQRLAPGPEAERVLRRPSVSIPFALLLICHLSCSSLSKFQCLPHMELKSYTGNSHEELSIVPIMSQAFGTRTWFHW